MARQSNKAIEYEGRARGMSWADLRSLWEEIKGGNTPDWEVGKALEYLVVRAFELSGLRVEYPYDVPPGGKPLEQIDGLVYLNSQAFLLECKDRDANDVLAIAKLQHQLLRRPVTTFGCVFVSGRFTEQALISADYAIPHRIMLWSGASIEAALKRQDFAAALWEKYHQLCMYGLTDHSPNYRDLEA